MPDKKEPTLVDRFLKFKVMKGFRERGYPMTKEYLERIDYELDIICQMSYGTYFLIVADLCRFMADNNILFVVRGSGCGSLVVWGLGISHEWLDPIEYGLPFERFLNPSRISMPDLDIDIDDTRRNEVVEYTIKKYGRDRVAKIITFGTLAAKNAIKDMARAMNIPEHDKVAASINAFIPNGKGEDGKNIRLADELRRNESLRECQTKYPELFAYAMRVEGKIRNASIHAAGTIITPDDMTKFLPVSYWGVPEERTAEEWFPTTQWDMYDAEERGLLKMDYLGLKTLRVVAQCVKAINFIRASEGLPPNFNINKIDRRDPAAWKLLSEGRTTCVFQIERTFVQNFARRMNLAALRDPWQLAVLVAIIRPGMMDSGNTERYLRRASGQEPVVQLHPLLEKVLAKTYGLMCFQEDVMWVVRALCNFTMAKADVLRKGVGKKNPAFIEKMKPDYDKGGAENQVSQEDLDNIWSQIEDHSRYSFNNAHAAAYGMVISYWTAFLKANYPLVFMNFMINSEAGTTSKEDGYNYKVAEYVEEARAMGIKVMPPCIKKSFATCSIDLNDKHIRFGLSLIKQMRTGAVNWIIEKARGANNFKDFVLAGWEMRPAPNGIHKPYSKISKTDYVSLIDSGALDCFEHGNRDKMHNMLEYLMKVTEKYWTQLGKEQAGKKTKPDCTSAVHLAAIEAYHVEDGSYKETNLEDRLNKEQEVTGCFLSDSPFAPFVDQARQYVNCTVGEVRDGIADSPQLIFMGLLNKVQPTVIKNGKNKGSEMGFVGFAGTDGRTIEAVVFNKQWAFINQMEKKADGTPLTLVDSRGKVFLVSLKRDKDRSDSYVLQEVKMMSTKR